MALAFVDSLSEEPFAIIRLGFASDIAVGGGSTEQLILGIAVALSRLPQVPGDGRIWFPGGTLTR